MNIKYFKRATFGFRKKLFSRLATLLDAHVPITESLQIIRSRTKKNEKQIIDNITLQVEQGSSFSEALKTIEGFSKEEIHIISIGEQTGNLSKNLQIISKLMIGRELLKRKIIGSLVYPTFVLVIALFVVVGIAIYILPAIIPVITSFRINIPISTKILLFTFSFFETNWKVILFGVLVILVVFAILISHKKPSQKIKEILFSLPIFKQIFRHHMTWKIFDTVSSLLESGLSPELAFESALDTIKSRSYTAIIQKIIKDLKNGLPLSLLLERSKVFSEEVVQLVTIGEKTGSLDSTLNLCAETHKDFLDRFYKRITELVGPITMIFLGLFIGYIALSIITPIYSATQNVYK